jgi:DNA-binding MarR family transcriptional regulator
MDKVPIPNDPLSTFSLSVFTINGLIMQSGELVTRPLGQSSARWQVLGRVGYQSQTVSQMSKDIGNTRQSVQRITNTLAAEGLVRFVDNPGDRRAQLIEITRKGADILDQIYERDRIWSEGLMRELDPEELIQVASALNTISHTFDKYIHVAKEEVL